MLPELHFDMLLELHFDMLLELHSDMLLELQHEIERVRRERESNRRDLSAICLYTLNLPVGWPLQMERNERERMDECH